jgi:16S rRNA (uracil1498-N3)-methyltransferase
VVKVHRQGVGDSLILFDPVNGLEADAVLREDRLPRVIVDVSEPRAAFTANMPVTVLQALGKSDKPEQAVRDVTALGATKLEFLQTSRTVGRGGKETRSDRLTRVAAQVARQCGRGDLPEIVSPRDFEEVMAEQGARESLRIVCGLDDETLPLLSLLEDSAFPSQAVTILIGPEGGFSPEEMAAARAVGFRAATLGPYVLRMEAACGAVLGALRALAVARL